MVMELFLLSLFTGFICLTECKPSECCGVKGGILSLKGYSDEDGEFISPVICLVATPSSSFLYGRLYCVGKYPFCNSFLG